MVGGGARAQGGASGFGGAARPPQGGEGGGSPWPRAGDGSGKERAETASSPRPSARRRPTSMAPASEKCARRFTSYFAHRLKEVQPIYVGILCGLQLRNRHTGKRNRVVSIH